MGAGKPVIMTDSLENSRYPDGTCIRISAGFSESAELEAVVRWAGRITGATARDRRQARQPTSVMRTRSSES